MFRRILALIDAQGAPERLACRLARRLHAQPGVIPLARPRASEFAGISPEEQQAVRDLDARVRAGPDTS